MSSAVEICNRALARLGIDQFIETIDDDSDEAKACKLFFDNVRDRLLAAFPWSFAVSRATLALKADEAARSGWLYVFALPADLIQPLFVWPAGLQGALFNVYPAGFPFLSNFFLMNPRAPRADQRVPYRIEKSSVSDGKVLLCDQTAPELHYIARVTDPAQFPPVFEDALCWKLAEEIVMPLSIKPEYARIAAKHYAMAVQEAFMRSEQGQQSDPLPDSELISSRF